MFCTREGRGREAALARKRSLFVCAVRGLLTRPHVLVAGGVGGAREEHASPPEPRAPSRHPGPNQRRWRNGTRGAQPRSYVAVHERRVRQRRANAPESPRHRGRQREALPHGMPDLVSMDRPPLLVALFSTIFSVILSVLFLPFFYPFPTRHDSARLFMLCAGRSRSFFF